MGFFETLSLFQVILSGLQLALILPAASDALQELEEKRRRERQRIWEDFLLIPLHDMGDKKRKQMAVTLTTYPGGGHEAVLEVPTQDSFEGLVVSRKIGAGGSATVFAAQWW